MTGAQPGASQDPGDGQVFRRVSAVRAVVPAVIGVDQQEAPALIKPFMARFGLSYPVVIDDGQGAITYDLIALPTSVFIDRGGVVRFIQIGEMTPLLMDTALAKIL